MLKGTPPQKKGEEKNEKERGDALPNGSLFEPPVLAGAAAAQAASARSTTDRLMVMCIFLKDNEGYSVQGVTRCEFAFFLAVERRGVGSIVGSQFAAILRLFIPPTRRKPEAVSLRNTIPSYRLDIVAHRDALRTVMRTGHDRDR